MQKQSVWLGPLRPIVRSAMIILVGLTLFMWAWLALGAMLFGTGIGMQNMLRPEGNLSVIATLWFGFGAIILVAVYLSDTVGAIETQPKGALDVVSLICARLAMVGIVAVVVVMFYEVVARYVFEKPTLWANEFSLWIAGFIFLLAGLYAMQQRSHISIYIVYDMMPRWAKKTSDVVSVALIWVFALSLIWGGFNEAWDKMIRWETFGTAWDPPLPGTIKPGILILIGLVAVQALSNLILDWNSDRGTHSPLDEIDQTEIENLRRTLESK
ncbi:TRAP transporter small permease subunit [Thioclava sp. FR2]|uniref:TRAP transporter small permease subunit n=1 Tax=Thioclava sp. FR2 TaxID=3445780 RepID=UPI003EB7C630